ncbi:hypothetical protein ACSSS7_000967 [Eimeria intestinalis]
MAAGLSPSSRADDHESVRKRRKDEESQGEGGKDAEAPSRSRKGRGSPREGGRRDGRHQERREAVKTQLSEEEEGEIGRPSAREHGEAEARSGRSSRREAYQDRDTEPERPRVSDKTDKYHSGSRRDRERSRREEKDRGGPSHRSYVDQGAQRYSDRDRGWGRGDRGDERRGYPGAERERERERGDERREGERADERGVPYRDRYRERQREADRDVASRGSHEKERRIAAAAAASRDYVREDRERHQKHKGRDHRAPPRRFEENRAEENGVRNPSRKRERQDQEGNQLVRIKREPQAETPRLRRSEERQKDRGRSSSSSGSGSSSSGSSSGSSSSGSSSSGSSSRGSSSTVSHGTGRRRRGGVDPRHAARRAFQRALEATRESRPERRAARQQRRSRSSSSKGSRGERRKLREDGSDKGGRQEPRSQQGVKTEGHEADIDEPAPPVDKDVEAYAAKKIRKVTAEDIGRAGGVYVPPFKLARLQQKTDDTKSAAYQRQMWEALRKSINGLVNKVNVSNITQLVQELFRENLVRGRGLFCRALIRAQLASPGFTAVYAALLCIVNSKLPDIGELVIKRVILQFRRAYRRNDKVVCLACVEFFAHLVNQRVAHELLALQLCELLLQEPTNDSVEVCIGFLKAVGQTLEDVCKPGFDAAFERLRAILQRGETDKKTQYSIEALWDIRRKGFKDFPGVIDDLDLVEMDDKITHEVDLLDTTIKGEEMLNIFKAQDPDEYESDEKKWTALSKEILGEESTDSNASSEDSEAETSSEEEVEEQPQEGGEKKVQIKDMTDQDIVNLRKTIYLCIMSSLNAEECVHKILKMNISEDLEMEVAVMLIDCCAMERTFQRFFALQAERLSKLRPAYCECFQEAFRRQYALVGPGLNSR